MASSPRSQPLACNVWRVVWWPCRRLPGWIPLSPPSSLKPCARRNLRHLLGRYGLGQPVVLRHKATWAWTRATSSPRASWQPRAMWPTAPWCRNCCGSLEGLQRAARGRYWGTAPTAGAASSVSSAHLWALHTRNGAAAASSTPCRRRQPAALQGALARRARIGD